MPRIQDHWSWKYFRSADSFFTHFYFGDPTLIHQDPRVQPEAEKTTELGTTEEEPSFLPDVVPQDPVQQEAIQRYDLASLAMARNETRKRARSPDNVVAPTDAAAAVLSTQYAQWDEFIASGGYQSDNRFRMHIEALNKVQNVFYKNWTDMKNKENPVRAGRLFHDYQEEKKRLMTGDATDADLMGLSWRFKMAVKENSDDPDVPTWKNDLKKFVEHALDNVLQSMDPVSPHFRRDLVKFNLQNDGGLKNIGMSAIVGVGPWKDGRPENVASVLFRLAKFKNLVPRSRDRQKLRLVLNLHDDFSADDILLSPIDAVMIHDSLQVLPTFERQLLIFKAFHGGSCLGVLMALSQEAEKKDVSTHAHRIRASKVPLSHDLTAKQLQKQLDTRTDANFQKPAALRDLYQEAVIGNPPVPDSTTADSDEEYSSESCPAIAEVAFIQPDGQSPPGSVDEHDLDADQNDRQVVADGPPADVGLPHAPALPDAISDEDEAPISDTTRAQLALEHDLKPEFIPNQPAVFLEQQRFLRDNMHGIDNDFPKRELPPVDAFLHEDCERDLVWAEKHSQASQDFYIFMRHRDPPAVISSCDSDFEESEANSMVFYGPSERIIGPDEDPRKDDDPSRYQTYMIDPVTRKPTDNVHKLDDYQWERYQKRMLGTYLDRIATVGTEEEVYMASMMYPGSYLKHSSCLEGKTDAEKRQIVGPHSAQKHADFHYNFGLADKRWADLARHVIIPNTREDDWGTPREAHDPLPDEVRAQAAHDYVRSLAMSAKPTLPILPDFPDLEQAPPLISDVDRIAVGSVNLSDIPEHDSIDCSDYPYGRQQHDDQQRDEVNQRLLEYESRWMSYYGKRFAENQMYDDSNSGSPPTTAPSSPVIRLEEESQFFTSDFVGTHPDAPVPTERTWIKKFNLPTPDHTIPSQVSTLDNVEDYDFIEPPTPQRVQENQQKLSHGVESKVQAQTVSFELPASILPFYKYGFMTTPRTGKGIYVHPITGNVLDTSYDFTLDGFYHFARREVEHFIQNPTAINRDYGLYLRPLGFDFQDTYSLRTETEKHYNGEDYFRCGAVGAFMRQFLYPRPLSLGLRRILRGWNTIGPMPKDSDSSSFPNVPPQLRKYVPSSVILRAGTATTKLAQMDRRFQPTHDSTGTSTTEMTRVQVSIERTKYWESTFFPAGASRSWLPLISDCDSHAWNLQETLCMILSKVAVLMRSMSLCTDAELPPSLRGIPHYQSTRPGFPFHAITITIGAMRDTTEWTSICPEISGVWAPKISGRFIGSFFCGAVVRIPVAEAKRKGITETAYLAAMKDRENTDKYYEEVTDSSGNKIKRRREGVYPTSLYGLHRAVRDPKTDKVLFFERWVWEGFNYDHTVLNKTTQTENHRNHLGEVEEKVNVGPRLHLVLIK